jgi:hypothetical protein
MLEMVNGERDILTESESLSDDANDSADDSTTRKLLPSDIPTECQRHYPAVPG